MIQLTKKERETLLILFKDFTSFYNANSISKILKISHVGAQKIFKRMLKENILTSRTIGKSIVYKLNFNNNYVGQLISFLLADEANNFNRWKEEFKELFKEGRIVMLFGSAIKDYAHAKDIDIMIVLDKKDAKVVESILVKKGRILPKKLHAIKLAREDLLNNLRKRQEAMINIVKNAIILYGYDKYTEVIKDVATF